MIKAHYISQNGEAGTSSTGMVSSTNRILQDVNYPTDEHQPAYRLATLMDTLNIRDRPDHAVRRSLSQNLDPLLMDSGPACL